jgi:ABC-type uncharacterized transport system permease subunit
MEWLYNAFAARIGWTLGEVAMALGVIAIVAAVYAAFAVPRLIRQSRCAHTRFFETGACDAVCRDCGKNLGFIGAWRQRLLSRS